MSDVPLLGDNVNVFRGHRIIAETKSNEVELETNRSIPARDKGIPALKLVEVVVRYISSVSAYGFFRPCVLIGLRVRALANCFFRCVERTRFP